MNTEIHETIKEIKAQFRLFMNGAISHSMREKGMGYKLNFGIEYPRIKEIAQGFSPSPALAQALWKENIRECKIMATLLYPRAEASRELCELWIEEMQYPELAEYAVMNLFQYLPDASDAAFAWMADERPYSALCGYLLMARLLMGGAVLEERSEAEFVDQAFAAMATDEPIVQKAAGTAMRKFVAAQRGNYRKISKHLSELATSSNALAVALAGEIKAEAL